MRLILLSTLLIAAAASAEPLRFDSGERRVSLLELYTSEGCSSCPPADTWLSELRRDPRLWRQLVPVALHVDYWNHLGWRDPFSHPRYSLRQRDYARHWGDGVVYTPGLVLNGREWRRGWRGRELELPDEGAGRLRAELDGDRLAVRYQPAEVLSGARLHVALLGFDLETAVPRGENAGRRLRHDFVALGYRELPLTAAGDGFLATLTLPEPVQPAPRYGLALWVSSSGEPGPLQAAGGPLPTAGP